LKKNKIKLIKISLFLHKLYYYTTTIRLRISDQIDILML